MGSNAIMTAVSGLNAYGEQLSIISNNISNSGTTSYKSNSVSFIDMLKESLSASATDATGAGVACSAVKTSWAQGSTTATNVATDLAIDGSGFFMVKDKSGDGTTYYTRNGGFDFDKTNLLVNGSGYALQGYTLDVTGNLGTLGDISVDYTATAPVPTSQIDTSVSLKSAATAGSNFTTTTDIYDSLGNAIPITITYTKNATANEWGWAASLPVTTPSTGSVSATTNNGTIIFDGSGKLIGATVNGGASATTNPQLSLELANGATTPQLISWNIFNSSGVSNDSLKQFSGDSVLNNQSQNGSASVSLSSISINEKGIVIGAYSDGSNKKLYQLALANFGNYDGLRNSGSGLYQSTVNSGIPIIGTAGSGQFGSISSKSLEASNVDLSAELAILVTAQRAYEACARVFSAADETMQTTVKMS